MKQQEKILGKKINTFASLKLKKLSRMQCSCAHREPAVGNPKRAYRDL